MWASPPRHRRDLAILLSLSRGAPARRILLADEAAGAPRSRDGPARRAGRRARDGEVRKAVPAPEPRKAPAGSPVVRCCSTSRVVASQDVCDVARGAGRVEKYTDTDGRVWDAAAHYIFSCRAGAECFARQKGCSAQLARTSNARRAAPMCKFCRRQQLATNLAGPARRTVSARRARCGCGRGFLSDGAHAVAAVVAAGPAGSRGWGRFFSAASRRILKSGRAALKSGSRALPVAALAPGRSMCCLIVTQEHTAVLQRWSTAARRGDPRFAGH